MQSQTNSTEGFEDGLSTQRFFLFLHSKDMAKLAQIATLEDLQHWQGIF